MWAGKCNKKCVICEGARGIERENYRETTINVEKTKQENAIKTSM